jgi:cyanophycinase-like exopeptidase
MADTVAYPAGSQYCFGIDENTALVVTGPWKGGRTGEVIGQSGVTLFDMTQAAVTMTSESGSHSSASDASEGGAWGMVGLVVSHLTRGDTLDLQSYEVSPAPFKTPLAVSE